MRRSARRSGNALVVSLALLVVVASFGAALHANARRLTVSTLAMRQDAASRWAAEGAIEAVRSALGRNGGDVDSGADIGGHVDSGADIGGAFDIDGGIDIGGEHVTVTVSPIDGRPDARLVVAVSTGDPSGPTARRGRARIEAVVGLGAALPTIDAWTER